MLNHRNLVANAFQRTWRARSRATTCSLAAGPRCFHVAGIAPIGFREPSRRGPGRHDRSSIRSEHRRIERERATVIMRSPRLPRSCAARSERGPRGRVPRRMIGHAGSPVANAVIEAGQRHLPGPKLAQFYGATERRRSSRACAAQETAIGKRVLGSCRVRAVHGVASKIVRDDGTEAEGVKRATLIRGTKGLPGLPGATRRDRGGLRGRVVTAAGRSAIRRRRLHVRRRPAEGA